MQKTSGYRRSAGRVKAHKRRLPGGGSVMVKAATRSAGKVKSYRKRRKGQGVMMRNSVGRLVYKPH